MAFEVNPKQALLIWKMITAETEEEREPLQSKTRPELSPKERQPLIENGFLSQEARQGKRGKYLVLTDKAWNWASGAFEVELMKSNSNVGAQALQGLLHRLLPFLKQREIPLANLFLVNSGSVLANSESAFANSGSGATRNVEPPDQRAPAAGSDAASLPEQIERACLQLGGGERKTRVRLSALRTMLSSVERGALDDALLHLQDERRLVLYRDDNSAALTDEDRAAALLVGGAPRHLVYWET